MATIGSTKSIPNPGYSPWTSKVELDTDTGKQIAYVYGGSGKLLYTGTPQEVVSQIPSNSSYNADKAFFDGLISTIDGQAAGLTAQNNQLNPPPNTEPLPVATNATPNPNTLTGTADADSGSEAKNVQAKNNPPNASGVYNENSNEMEVQAKNYAGSTQAGSANVATKRPGYTTGELPGLRIQNPLSNLSSYTYQTTLYMITPDAYTAFIESGRTNIDAIKKAVTTSAAAAVKASESGAYIVAQSGGIGPTQQRIPGADFDFYIDELKIYNYLQGSATTTSSNDYKITFNIYEPQGFSLITKLTNASDHLRSVSKVKNFNKQSNPTRHFFILGLRFQGYDEAGQVLTKKTFPQDNFNSDSGGVFERFFDIEIRSFKFKLDGKVTVYNIESVVIGPGTAMGVKRGRIDSGATVQGETVDQALQGKDGLLTKLNKQLKERADADPNKVSVPSEYKLVYVGPGTKELIGDSPIVNITNLVKNTWPMGEGIQDIRGVNENASVRLLPNSNQRNITWKNGVSIMQAVQDIITQSDYMLDALTAIIPNQEEPNPKPNSESKKRGTKTPGIFRWYNLSAEVKVKEFDTSIKDFAYEITYIIQPYDTPYVRSKHLTATKEYYGAHKRYDYWYTGKNSEILSYEQTMNNAFFNATLNPGTATGNDDVPSSPGKYTNETKTTLLNTSKQAQNSVLASLFSVADYAQVKLTIMGDPDYLMTESSGSPNAVYRQFYGQDFTINPNGGQVFIEIDFKEAEDYGTNGLLTINQSVLFWNYPKQIKDIVKGISYVVVQVQHSFSKGKFTQELTCRINPFNNYNDPELYRSTASDPNTNIGSEGEAGVRTSETQGGGVDKTQTAGNTGLKGDPIVQPVNPELGNQGGTSNQPSVLASSPNDDRDPPPAVVIASQGREPPESGNRLNPITKEVSGNEA